MVERMSISASAWLKAKPDTRIDYEVTRQGWRRWRYDIRWESEVGGYEAYGEGYRSERAARDAAVRFVDKLL
jgi:hypothetical protein